MEQHLFRGSEQFAFSRVDESFEIPAVNSRKDSGYPQETETQVPRHQNFIPQWSTTVPLPSRSPPRAGLLLTPVDSVLQWRCKASAPCTHTWAVPANLEQSRLFWALIPHESQQVELIPAGPLAPSPLSWQDAEICPASPAGAAG